MLCSLSLEMPSCPLVSSTASLDPRTPILKESKGLYSELHAELPDSCSQRPLSCPAVL